MAGWRGQGGGGGGVDGCTEKHAQTNLPLLGGGVGGGCSHETPDVAFRSATPTS